VKLPTPGLRRIYPTNDTLIDERHVRVAIGRDYADVPPTRGVFRRKAESELAVTVRIAPTQWALTDELPLEPSTWLPSAEVMDERDQVQQQIVPQQQQ
jgi:transglutaminase-like putative cysteine protease